MIRPWEARSPHPRVQVPGLSACSESTGWNTPSTAPAGALGVGWHEVRVGPQREARISVAQVLG